jgi:hypothetical protein
VSKYIPRLHKKGEEIERKLQELIQAAATLHDAGIDVSRSGRQSEGERLEKLVRFREVRASALNLLGRLSSKDSVYYRELAEAQFTEHLALRGILQAALQDYRDGFMADSTLLVSAEIFRDLLDQAQILLESDYKDAAAVTIRAVLEDGLRRLCVARGLESEPRNTISKLNDRLYREGVYQALQHKEITAKAQIGNDAAHARHDNYSKGDVEAFLQFVIRFLSMHLT